MRYLLVIGLALAGCGGGDDEQLQCSVSARDGTYRVTATEVGGTCGEISPGLVTLGRDKPSGSPSGASDCDQTFAEWSEDWCSLSAEGFCVDVDGTVSEYIAISHQRTTDGSHIDGTYDVTLRMRGSGIVLCSSTYELRYVRQ